MAMKQALVVSLFLLAAMANAANDEDHSAAEAKFRKLMMGGRRLEDGCEKLTKDLCTCYMGCEVMGSDSSKCEDDEKKNEVAIMAVALGLMGDDAKACDVLKCGSYCGKATGCANDETKESCEASKKAMKPTVTRQGEIECDVNCDAAFPAKAPGFFGKLLGFMGMLLAYSMH